MFGVDTHAIDEANIHVRSLGIAGEAQQIPADPIFFEKNEKVVDSSWLCICHWKPRQVNAAGNMYWPPTEGNLKSSFCRTDFDGSPHPPRVVLIAFAPQRI
ncbi:hypothetical protein [Rhizobium leguminosarum]|uniref:hypothetical protein n=1 Tax=Rhizobium leguminosarum TaxID=384 RepID=UPI0028F3F83E|nr:hypothetical protein [Rhizobium leguminosarum]